MISPPHGLPFTEMVQLKILISVWLKSAHGVWTIYLN